MDLLKQKTKILKLLSDEVKNKWELIEQLGVEGKDGIVYSVINKETGKEGAIKIFKKRKSVKKIQKEKDFYDVSSKLEISPKILSDWEINENNKCFVMEKLDKTLKEVVKSQKLTLNENQINRLIYIFQKLSEIKIWHNDPNVFLNTMIDKQGKFFIIDYGFSKYVPKKRIKEKGPYFNFSLLYTIDYAMKKNYFKDLILNYQKEHNMSFDYYNYYTKK